jgi:hypothetical protein
MMGMMTTRATDKEKMGMMEARTVAKMRGQGEMPTVDAMDGDGELECDFTLGTQQTRMLAEDILDINAGEKALMTIWNEHLTTYVRVGQDFVESHFNAVPDLCLYGNFVCHVTTLQQAGLITHTAMWTSLPRWTESPRAGLTWTQ